MEDKLEQIAHDFVAEFCGGSETVEDILYARLSALAAPAVAETPLTITEEQVDALQLAVYDDDGQHFRGPKWTAAFTKRLNAALAAQAPQVAETGRTAIDEAQAYMLDRCLEVIRGEVPREAFTAADLAVSEALAAAQAPKPSTKTCEVQRGQSVWIEGTIVHGDQPIDFPKRARIHIRGIGTGIPIAFKPVTEAAAPASLSTGRLDLEKFYCE